MKLKQRIARLLFKWHGWKLTGKPVPPETYRCVFVFAPHTSNWDFYFGLLCMFSMGVPTKVVIKKFWTRFPFNLLIRPLGGMGIDRTRDKNGQRKNQVQMLADLFKRFDKIALVITPEGSRSRRSHWKTGFYHIARAARVPIVTLTADFKNRTVRFGPVFYGTEPLDEVMHRMMAFFKKGVPLLPEQFALDEKYI